MINKILMNIARIVFSKQIAIIEDLTYENLIAWKIYHDHTVRQYTDFIKSHGLTIADFQARSAPTNEDQYTITDMFGDTYDISEFSEDEAGDNLPLVINRKAIAESTLPEYEKWRGAYADSDSVTPSEFIPSGEAGPFWSIID